MRGLGEIQIGIMLFCQENEAPRATFSVAVMRNRLAKDRGVLRCDLKGFKQSYSRALEGLVSREHLIWGNRRRSRVRRGPVRPELPGLALKDEEEFRAYILREAARPPSEEEEVGDYLTDKPDDDNDPIEVMKRIVVHSNDVDASLMATRFLARELGNLSAANAPKDARWRVIRVAPGGKDHHERVET